MITIRQAETADLEPMMAIETAAYPLDAWTDEQMRYELERMAVDRWYAVATSDLGLRDSAAADDVVGYVGLYLSAPDADIQTIAVSPRARGQRIGAALLAAATDHAWQIGCTRMFLEVRADNDAALALYRAAGFTRQGRRRRYYVDGGDAITMRLRRNEVDLLGMTRG